SLYQFRRVHLAVGSLAIGEKTAVNSTHTASNTRRKATKSEAKNEHGGPGRTRTSNQTVMSAPMRRHAYFDFAEVLDGRAVLTNEIANNGRRSFPAIASTAQRMCAGW